LQTPSCEGNSRSGQKFSLLLNLGVIFHCYTA
jgi:hypothetical protein